MAANRNSNGSIMSWIFGIILVFAFAHTVLNSDNSTTSSPSRPVNESTEDVMGRIYASQGYYPDDKSIQDSAREVEQLYREFGSMQGDSRSR